MPAAGRENASRAVAHLKWAERYADQKTDQGTRKAISHFGRALEYERRANEDSRFGVSAEVYKAILPSLGTKVAASAGAAAIAAGAAGLVGITGASAAYRAAASYFVPDPTAGITTVTPEPHTTGANATPHALPEPAWSVPPPLPAALAEPIPLGPLSPNRVPTLKSESSERVGTSIQAYYTPRSTISVGVRTNVSGPIAPTGLQLTSHPPRVEQTEQTDHEKYQATLRSVIGSLDQIAKVRLAAVARKCLDAYRMIHEARNGAKKDDGSAWSPWSAMSRAWSGQNEKKAREHAKMLENQINCILAGGMACKAESQDDFHSQEYEASLRNKGLPLVRSTLADGPYKGFSDRGSLAVMQQAVEAIARLAEDR
jgi:hypothetical protein